MSALAPKWAQLTRRDLAPGALLQATGTPLRAAWFVEHGLLRSCFVDADGRDRNRAFHAEGEWAGAPPSRRPLAADFAIGRSR